MIRRRVSLLHSSRQNAVWNPVRGLAVAVTITIAQLANISAEARAGASFEITFTPKVSEAPLSTTVYVMLASASKTKTAAEPRFGPDWFRPQPFFSVEAKDWKPGEPLTFGSTAKGFPDPLDKLPPGEYSAQAVIRLNRDTHSLGDGEGNAYGPVTTFKVEADKETVVKLLADRIVPKKAFTETDRVKLVDIESPMLSAFHKRPIRHRAAVVLPEGDLSRKRASLYIIPGFGGDHNSAARILASPRFGFGKDMVRVLLNPDCGTGHHVFADSAYNGPHGKAFIEELIPYIEKTYPVIADPKARLLNGHSSGGWSSLWLQVTYPDSFAGTWSTSPDPVDFRDFQKIDLYAKNENMFKDPEGNRRPIARMGTRAVLFYDNFSKMEDVIGDGGQLHSFEAVFSKLGPDGRPKPLWDRKTGAIDSEVAKDWEAYDIRLILERNWNTLGPKLKGKLHVITGSLDTFYLEGAVALLKQSLEKLGSDAEVEIIPDKDHGSILDAALAERIDRGMNETLTRNGVK